MIPPLTVIFNAVSNNNLHSPLLNQSHLEVISVILLQLTHHLYPLINYFNIMITELIN